MPGDPKECRRHAEQCRKLAAAAGTQQLKATFLSVSRNWEMLAIQLEDALAKLVENEALRLNIRKRGKIHGGKILRFTDSRESDSFWEWCRRQT